MTWRREPGSGDPRPEEASPEGDRTGYGHWEEEGGEGPAGGDPATGICELCGGPTLDRHCKVLCLRCGYQRDCSDP